MNSKAGNQKRKYTPTLSLKYVKKGNKGLNPFLKQVKMVIMRFVFVLLILGILSTSCNEIKLVNSQDILDLLKDDGSSNVNSPSNSSQSSSTNSSIQNGNSQNLNYYGLTDSPTGTNTYGSTGSTVGNPLGY